MQLYIYIGFPFPFRGRARRHAGGYLPTNNGLARHDVNIYPQVMAFYEMWAWRLNLYSPILPYMALLWLGLGFGLACALAWLRPWLGSFIISLAHAFVHSRAHSPSRARIHSVTH